MRWKDFKQMIISHEWHTRITLGMAITLLAGVWYIASFVNKTESNININAEDIKELTLEQKETSKNVHEIQLYNVEVKTTLANIEQRQIEILTILKDK